MAPEELWQKLNYLKNTFVLFCRERTEALSAEHPENSMSKPLTDEQLWGLPESELPQTQQVHECPYKGVQCLCWDHGCQADICVLEMGDGQ